mmetsp:Transcript_4798/g.18157  ORF Transcript_4798/g.18157 Transcript_4798/m.18157 type:complete len:207 (-) Transcript_4798:611-1231(-)
MQCSWSRMSSDARASAPTPASERAHALAGRRARRRWARPCTSGCGTSLQASAALVERPPPSRPRASAAARRTAWSPSRAILPPKAAATFALAARCSNCTEARSWLSAAAAAGQMRPRAFAACLLTQRRGELSRCGMKANQPSGPSLARTSSTLRLAIASDWPKHSNLLATVAATEAEATAAMPHSMPHGGGASALAAVSCTANSES